MTSWLRAPGQGEYARPEREIRVVLARLPEGLGEGRLVDDLYVEGTTLRLRRVRDEDAVVHKLTQKVRPDPADPSVVSITNVYVTAAEYELLAQLPGRVLRKVRREWQVDGREWAVDEFLGRWHGLVLAELELADGETAVPEFPEALDVTRDDRFSGGALAAASDDEVEALLTVARGALGGGAG